MKPAASAAIRAPQSARRTSVALHLRAEIEKAEEAGVPREDMSLHLTLSDVSHLKRDRTVPVDDISFAGGKMRYLGVEIVQGGVTTSVLNVPDAAGES